MAAIAKPGPKGQKTILPSRADMVGKMAEYAEAQRLKAEQDAKMKELKPEILAWAKANPGAFVGTKLDLEAGFVKLSEKTVVKEGEAFDFYGFAKRFPQFLKKSFDITALKKLVTNGSASELEKMHINLATEEELVIEVKAAP